MCVFIETIHQFNDSLPLLQFNSKRLHFLVQSKTIVTAKLIISNPQRSVTAIKAVSFVLLSLPLVGSELMVDIDVTLDVEVGEELSLKVKEKVNTLGLFR